jgi:hypothetical protein
VERLLSQSSLEGRNLARITKLLLPGRLCPEGQCTQSLFVKMLSVSPVLPQFQDGCKENVSEQIQK